MGKEKNVETRKFNDEFLKEYAASFVKKTEKLNDSELEEAILTMDQKLFDGFKRLIKRKGKYLDTLEYGADRYDFRGFSVVVDEDSMAQSDKKKESVKYLILRPDGHLYTKWDTKASLLF